MKFNSARYERAFDEFTIRCPMWSERAVKYVPRHETIIRVFLDNDDCVDYDDRSGTFRYISKDNIGDRDDITDENCRSVFARNLSDLMQARSIGQKTLTEKTGISQGMLSNYLKEKSTPSLTSVKKIAKALDCGIDELTEW